jgi:ribosome-binding protein aMBF1 (putative translation factor)
MRDLENSQAHVGRKSRLRTAREKAGLSIKQASERLDWPTWLIEKYEAGHALPPSVCLRWLADAYGVAVAWLGDDPAREGK